MSRAWITGLTMAGVVGTGGAALAGLGAGSDQGVAPDAQPASAAGRVAVSRSTTTTTYQVGAAGSVTIVKAGDSLTVSESAADVGWAVGSATSSGGHSEVQFTDNLQVVTFSADLIDGQIVVSLSNVAGPGAPTTEATPMAVTVITGPPAAPVTNGYKPRPAAPAPTTQPRPAPTTPPPATTAPAPTTLAPPVSAPEAPPAPTTQAPPVAPPAPSATTAPSGGGDEDEDEEHDDEDDHEDEDDDHQDAGDEGDDDDGHEEPGDD